MRRCIHSIWYTYIQYMCTYVYVCTYCMCVCTYYLPARLMSIICWCIDVRTYACVSCILGAHSVWVYCTYVSVTGCHCFQCKPSTCMYVCYRTENSTCLALLSRIGFYMTLCALRSSLLTDKQISSSHFHCTCKMAKGVWPCGITTLQYSITTCPSVPWFTRCTFHICCMYNLPSTWFEVL
jgi:hypothetical protein